MTRRYKTDDQLRDDASHSNPEVDILTQPAGDVPVTDPDGVISTQTYTVAAKGATVDLSATTAATLEDDAVQISHITYTPTSTISPPASGNSRVWTVKQGSTSLGSLTVDNSSSAKTGGVAVQFTLTGSAASVAAGAVTLESAHGGGSGLADPGGTLTIELTL